MTHRRWMQVILVIWAGAQAAGCASTGPNYREVGGPIEGMSPLAVLDAAEVALERRFRIETRDDKAMTIVTQDAIENPVPGSRLDRYRRKAHLKVVTVNGTVRTQIHISLERATSETPVFYTGPWEPSWDDIGRDADMEEAVAREIRSALGMEEDSG